MADDGSDSFERIDLLDRAVADSSTAPDRVRTRCVQARSDAEELPSQAALVHSTQTRATT
jgi:hypothetical protein